MPRCPGRSRHRPNAIDGPGKAERLTDDDRFARDIAANLAAAGLTGRPARLGLAVSGGPDSMALLTLASASMRDHIAVASVDHGLRTEAAAECALVASVCAAMDVPHDVLRVTVAPGNMQSRARHARYAALSEWAGAHGLDAIVTAHHADDQVETLVMRMARGAGTRGLAAMRAVATVPGGSLPLLRPLLGWRRHELGTIVESAGIPAVQDPSNTDMQYLRVRVRQWLADAPPGVDAQRIAASVAHLGMDDDALDWATRREYDECVSQCGDALCYRPAAPPAIRLRVLTRIILELAHEGAPRGDEIARLANRLGRGETATLAGVKCTGAGPVWTFRRAPARRFGGPAR